MTTCSDIVFASFLVFFLIKIYLCQRVEDQNIPIVLILDSETSRASLNSPNSMLLISSLASMKKSAPQASRCGDGWQIWSAGIWEWVCMYIKSYVYTIWFILDIWCDYILYSTGLKMRKHRVAWCFFMDPNFRVVYISLQFQLLYESLHKGTSLRPHPLWFAGVANFQPSKSQWKS